MEPAHSLLPVSAAPRFPAAEACFRPWRGYVHTGQQFPYEGRDPPTSSRFRVSTLLRQPWQRPCMPSGICRRPCLLAAASACLMRLSEASSLTEHQTRTSAFSPRLRVRPAAGNAPFLQRQPAGSQSQRADLGLESPSYIRWRSFVVQRQALESHRRDRQQNRMDLLFARCGSARHAWSVQRASKVS